jgi:hypothetical protein
VGVSPKRRLIESHPNGNRSPQCQICDEYAIYATAAAAAATAAATNAAAAAAATATAAAAATATATAAVEGGFWIDLGLWRVGFG